MVAEKLYFLYHAQMSSGSRPCVAHYVPGAVSLDVQASGFEAASLSTSDIYFRLLPGFLFAFVAWCLGNNSHIYEFSFQVFNFAVFYKVLKFFMIFEKH
jgi:hypothetical protein